VSKSSGTIIFNLSGLLKESARHKSFPFMAGFVCMSLILYQLYTGFWKQKVYCVVFYLYSGEPFSYGKVYALSPSPAIILVHPGLQGETNCLVTVCGSLTRAAGIQDPTLRGNCVTLPPASSR
jgi:hypothetical protein